MSRRTLHSTTEPIESGFLPADGLHAVWWERSGNPEGIPVVFVHGGPGAGTSERDRGFFDPGKYHVVRFDQRGAGRSTPAGECRENTTGLLIGDMERLRERLGIERWLVFGGSWGSTLALAYAQAHPQRCLGLVLRGVWLASAEEMDWWLHGMRQFFPKAWEAFAQALPAAERGDLLGSYLRRLNDPDPAVHGPAARAWSRYEGACVRLIPEPEVQDDAQTELNLARLEAHYFSHGAFLRPGQLLDEVPRIAHLPCVIVHGRYDVVCPVRYAHALADAWPSARLVVVPDAGHSSTEPGIVSALVAATDAFELDAQGKGMFRAP